jgi:hypothetical protein
MMGGFVVRLPRHVVTKGPGPARGSEEVTDIVGYSGSETDDPTEFMKLAPEIDIDGALLRERGDENIPDRAASFGPTLVQRQFEPNASKGFREERPADFRGLAQRFHSFLFRSSFDGLTRAG